MGKASPYCRVTCLDYGEEQGFTNLFYADKPSEQFVFPIPGFYIETDSGSKILFDTGCSPDFKQTWGLLNEFMPYVRPSFMLDQLKKVGVTPQDIDYVIMSHLHYDHGGGAVLIQGRQGQNSGAES